MPWNNAGYRGFKFAAAVLTLLFVLAGCDGGENDSGVASLSDEGSVTVDVSTTGMDVDPDGYTVSLAGQSQSISVNGSLTFNRVPAGSQTVELSDIEPNCTPSEGTSQTVDVPSGSTTPASFSIDCVADEGEITVTAATSGADSDPDGYDVSVDGEIATSIGTNETVTISKVPAGSRTVELTDVAENCSISGDNPRDVSVSFQEKTTTTFDVTCTRLPQISFGRILSDDDADIFLINADGSNEKAIVANPGVQDGDPAWRPDGEWFVFTSNRDGDFDLYITAPDAEEIVNVTNSSARDLRPRWSPLGGDGKILFVTDRDGGLNEIYHMDADGDDPFNLTRSSDIDETPAWSPDARRIVFASRRDGDFEIYTMDRSGTDVTQLTNNATRDAYPVFTPDGSKIVFASDRTGNYEIYSMDREGTSVTQLTNNAADDIQPAVSPDGATIAFVSDQNENYDLYTMNIDGTEITRLTDTPEDEFRPTWRPSD